MAGYRLEVTVGDVDIEDDCAERWLDALLALHSDLGPVVSQNTLSGNLTVTMSLDAPTMWAMMSLASAVVISSLGYADIVATPIVHLHAHELARSLS